MHLTWIWSLSFHSLIDGRHCPWHESPPLIETPKQHMRWNFSPIIILLSWNSIDMRLVTKRMTIELWLCVATFVRSWVRNSWTTLEDAVLRSLGENWDRVASDTCTGATISQHVSYYYIVLFCSDQHHKPTSVREDHLLARAALVSARVASYLLHRELQNLAACWYQLLFIELSWSHLRWSEGWHSRIIEPLVPLYSTKYTFTCL